MNHLQQTGLLRLAQIIGNPKANPPIPPIIPVSKSCFWQMVADGRAPKSIKLGNGRATFWRASDIYALIEPA